MKFFCVGHPTDKGGSGNEIKVKVKIFKPVFSALHGPKWKLSVPIKRETETLEFPYLFILAACLG